MRVPFVLARSQNILQKLSSWSQHASLYRNMSSLHKSFSAPSSLSLVKTPFIAPMCIRFFSVDSKKQNPNRRPIESAWKASSTGLNDQQRQELVRKMNLDLDVSPLVTEETPVYEITKRPLYRFFFVFVVLQYFFWTYCANILFSFYAGVDRNGNKLSDVANNELKQGSGGSFMRVWAQNLFSSGYQFIVQASFFAIGNIFAVVMLFLMTRCVTSIRLLPGAKQAKIGTMTVFGGVSPKKTRIIPLKDLSSIEHRRQRVNYYSLRVRGQNFSYLIDSEGEFPNETLYDHTIGVYRNLESTD